MNPRPTTPTYPLARATIAVMNIKHDVMSNTSYYLPLYYTVKSEILNINKENPLDGISTIYVEFMNIQLLILTHRLLSY